MGDHDNGSGFMFCCFVAPDEAPCQRYGVAMLKGNKTGMLALLRQLVAHGLLEGWATTPFTCSASMSLLSASIAKKSYLLNAIQYASCAKSQELLWPTKRHWNCTARSEGERSSSALGDAVYA
jgi:hypothetical protein